MEGKEKTRVTVMIMGEEYILRGTSSPEEMHRVGLYVNRMMQDLADKNAQMSRHRIAVLAALNIADELMRLKREVACSGSDRGEHGGEDELA